MAKVWTEFGMAMSTRYPHSEYPQDLIDSIVMPALRRSFDKARRENWKLAKETTAQFEMVRGPVMIHYSHEPPFDRPDVDADDDAFWEWLKLAVHNDDDDGCPGCEYGLPMIFDGYNHHFGWYVAVEIDDTEEEEVSENALPERPVTPKAPSRVTRFGRP